GGENYSAECLDHVTPQFRIPPGTETLPLMTPEERSHAVLPSTLACWFPELSWVLLSTWSLLPVLTEPLDELLEEPLTPEATSPELLCSLSMPPPRPPPSEFSATLPFASESMPELLSISGELA